MTNEAELQKLESVVASLMGRFKALKQEKLELESQLQAKEDRIVELDEQISSLTEEKTDVRGRVSSLLGSIEEWEQNLDMDAQEFNGDETAGGSDDDQAAATGESKLFQVGE